MPSDALTQTAPPPTPAGTIGPAKLRPVIAWAVLGGGFIALQGYVYATWILGGRATATPVGPDEPPTWMKITIRSWEAAMVVALIAVVALVVIRPWRRHGRPSFDGVFVLALLTMYWQDPFLNYSQVWYTYNAYFINLGNWSTSLPGWLSPQGHLVAEPLLGVLPMYGTVIFGLCVVANRSMRWARGRWALGTVSLIAVCVAVFIVVDLLLEIVWMRVGFYTFAGAVKGWTLFPGHYYQYPVYVAVISGSWFAALACVRFFRNDFGHTIAERGLEWVGPPRRRPSVSFLALAGVLNTIWLLTNVVLQVPGLHAGPWPDDILRRSYLTNTVCGPRTTYACSGPAVPIPRPGSDRLGPDGRLVRPAS